MVAQNAFYAQSGGVTAVMNASACGVIETVRAHSDKIQKVFAGRDGILGALKEDLIDTSLESTEAISALKHTPGAAFGSCRYSLKKNKAEYERLIEVFKAHDIGYFFYNGGNDSQETTYKVTQIANNLNYPLTCIGIPKTVDNDLALTDNAPGFGSVAKYIAVSILEGSFDVCAMASNSTKVFILEVMGRNAGWIAASSGLAQTTPADPPHIILFPELAFSSELFLEQVKNAVKQYGFCSIVASEGIRNKKAQFLSVADSKDAFGHNQLGGVAKILANIVTKELGFKTHFAVSDYLQRSARHIASQTDVDQAYAVGKAAIEFAVAGKTNIMPIIVRDSNDPYRYHIGEAPLQDVASVEKKLPKDFIDKMGFGITEACREYLLPLIQGEAYPPYKNGIPDYVVMQTNFVEKKLPTFDIDGSVN